MEAGRKKHRILFICLGNICRSPMAEFVMKDMVGKKGLADQFFIASAATSDLEIYNGVGSPMYPPAVEELVKRGIACTKRRAVQVTESDYEDYDYLICMDAENLADLKKSIGEDYQNKVSLLLDFTERPGASIADPYFTRDFEVTYLDVVEGCRGLLEYILEKHY